MINEYLIEALGEISQEKIAEAANIKKTKRLKAVKIAAAACLVLAALAVAAAVRADKIDVKGANDIITEAEQHNTQAAVESAAQGTTAAVSELYQIKKWDEKQSFEKYTELVLNGKAYGATGRQAEESQIGESLGAAKCSGYDIYAEETHESSCEVFEIAGFGSDFLVAAAFEGEFYTYKSRDYFPSDLGDFTDTLNFNENITVDVSFMFTKTDEITSTGRELLTGSTLSAMLFELLKENGNAPAEKYDNGSSQRSMGRALEFGVYSPLLSKYSLSLVVTDSGYVKTNLIDTGVAFFVGEDAVKPLFDFAVQLSLEQETTAAPPSDPQQYTGSDVVDYVDDYSVTEVFSQPVVFEE